MSSLAWFFKLVTCLIVVQTCFVVPKVVATSSKDDKITALPRQPPVEFNQYSGYVEVGANEERSMFYYFVEAESNPETKPLVLWLNGGPGCSSLAGAFITGRGPFLPNGEVLLKNEFSWNQEANVLFLESPVGVGFSYSSNKSFYNFTNDEITAQDNLKVLFGWLEKFPDYKNRDLFISGVSYGGHYVPQLANLILESRLKSNLKGIAIGNPRLEFDIEKNSMAEFLWSHGLISDATYSMTNSICNISQIFRQLIPGANLSAACSQVYEQAVEEIGSFVTTSDVLTDVCHSPPQPNVGNGLNVCVKNEVEKYLNRKDVQEVLHARLVGVDQWSSCTSDIGYTEQDGLMPTLPLLGKLVKGGVQVMVFSGDQDASLPFMATRSLIKSLAEGLGLNTTTPYTSWLHNKQAGGWTQVYGDILSFATVRGGGHDSSFVQPERTLVLLNAFLQGNPLPVPTQP